MYIGTAEIIEPPVDTEAPISSFGLFECIESEYHTISEYELSAWPIKLNGENFHCQFVECTNKKITVCTKSNLLIMIANGLYNHTKLQCVKFYTDKTFKYTSISSIRAGKCASEGTTFNRTFNRQAENQQQNNTHFCQDIVKLQYAGQMVLILDGDHVIGPAYVLFKDLIRAGAVDSAPSATTCM